MNMRDKPTDDTAIRMAGKDDPEIPAPQPDTPEIEPGEGDPEIQPGEAKPELPPTEPDEVPIEQPSQPEIPVPGPSGPEVGHDLNA